MLSFLVESALARCDWHHARAFLDDLSGINKHAPCLLSAEAPKPTAFLMTAISTVMLASSMAQIVRRRTEWMTRSNLGAISEYFGNASPK